MLHTWFVFHEGGAISILAFVPVHSDLIFSMFLYLQHTVSVTQSRNHVLSTIITLSLTRLHKAIYSQWFCWWPCFQSHWIWTLHMKHGSFSPRTTVWWIWWRVPVPRFGWGSGEWTSTLDCRAEKHNDVWGREITETLNIYIHQYLLPATFSKSIPPVTQSVTSLDESWERLLPEKPNHIFFNAQQWAQTQSDNNPQTSSRKVFERENDQICELKVITVHKWSGGCICKMIASYLCVDRSVCSCVHLSLRLWSTL